MISIKKFSDIFIIITIKTNYYYNSEKDIIICTLPEKSMLSSKIHYIHMAYVKKKEEYEILTLPL